MHSRSLLAVVLSGLVAVACSDRQPTVPDQLTSPPEFNFMNGPDDPGSGVVWRITLDENTDFWWMYVLDERTHLLAEATTDPNGICQGGASADRPVDLQVAGFNLLVQSSDWYATVYDATNWTGNIYNLADYCAWTGAQLQLATGLVDFLRHYSGSAQDWMVRGLLDRTDGLGRTQLVMKLGRLYDPKPPYGFIGFKNQDTHLNPDPRD